MIAIIFQNDGVNVGTIDICDMKKKGQGCKRKLDTTFDRCVTRTLVKGFGIQLTSTVNQKKVSAVSDKVHISTVYRSAHKDYGDNYHNRSLKKTDKKMLTRSDVT